MNPHDQIRQAILDEGNGGLHLDEIMYVTGLAKNKIVLTLAAMRGANTVIECEPGCWMVTS